MAKQNKQNAIKVTKKYIIDNKPIIIDDLEFNLTVEEFDYLEILEVLEHDRAEAYDMIRELTKQELTNRQAYELFVHIAEYYAEKRTLEQKLIQKNIRKPR